MHRRCPSLDNRGGRASLLFVLAAMAAIAGACGHSSPQAGSTSTTPEGRSTTALPTTAPAAITTAGPTTAGPTTAGPPTAGPTTTGSTASTRATATTLVTTTAKTAATTRWAPPSPQPTPSQAAYALVNAWAGHDRSVALMDASPAAVAALFSNRYPAGGPQYRGCSTPPGNAPASCVWRSGDELLSLTVTYFSNGYGVTAAMMEN